MRITDDIVHKVNSELNTVGRPHHVEDSPGEWVDTGCVAWPLPRESEGPMGFAWKHYELLRKYHEFVREERMAEAEEILNQLKELVSPFKPTMIQGMAVLDMGDITSTDPYIGVNRLLWKTREVLIDSHVYVYRTDLEWMTYDVAVAKTLVVAPVDNQLEVLRIERTAGENFGSDTERIIGTLRDLDRQFGIDIVGAGRGTVEFLLKRVPKGKEAKALGKWLFEFCPSIWETPKQFAKGRVALWWD